MTPRYPSALLLSLTLHGAIAALMFLFAYAANLAKPETTQVFELVAGEGVNFAETKAPALGNPGALKVDMPKEEPKPREVAPPEPTPVAPAPPPPVAEKPLPKPPEEKPLPKLPDPKSIAKKMDRVDEKTKAKIEKQQKAEAKLTKEQFDKTNKQKASVAPAGPPKVAKIDTKGIREGVSGGSVENDRGGAGGKALVRPDGPVMEAYLSLLQQRLRAAFNKPPGLSDTLVTTIKVHINADGSLTGARITQFSGSDEFDAAAMAAVAATRMPPHPNKGEDLSLPFKMKEQE